MCIRDRVVGAFPDGNSALMLVCARLRHVAGTQWGSKKYMNMKHLEAVSYTHLDVYKRQQEDAMIQEAAPGDTLAVFSTGAYNYSMSSNYNRIPKPPIVMVKAGSSRVIVKRETYDDLIKNDV